MTNTTQPSTVPETIGLIIDGNRRWARAQGLPALEGHRVGYDTVKKFVRWARDAGVKNVFVYAFSTENWKRTPEELDRLFGLLRWVLTSEIAELKKEQAQVIFVGQRERFAPEIQELMTKAEEETKGGTVRLFIGISYGGRAEIVDAIKHVPEEEKAALTEEGFAQYLWTRDMPDPDLIIRTGGEKRLSNFLLWQGAYAELYFSDTLWPAFTEEELKAILADYAAREKRFGV